MTRRLALALATCFAVLHPQGSAAQFEDPCEWTCAGVLGATAFVAATGISVGVGRATGGLTRVNQGLLLWGGSFAAVVGSGVALSGNGARQERAVYGAGIGTLAGALLGSALEALRTGGDGPRVVAGMLIGAAAGAIVGGVYGAATHESENGGEPLPLLSVRLSF